MAKSDIVASLKLNSSDYEQKLAKAKENTRRFSRDGGQGLADIADKFSKLAVAVAGSQAAMAAFNKVMSSSQTYADTYANAIASVRGVVDNVVYSLANSDFSSFERGLRKVAEASWAASAALDQLWNTKQSASYFTAKNRERLVELLNVAKDESKTAEQRKQAQAMIDEVLKDQKEVIDVTRQDVDKAIYALIDKAAGGRLTEANIDKALIEETLRIDVSLDRDNLKKQLAEQYEEYRKESARIADQYATYSTTVSGTGYRSTVRTGVSEEGKAQLAALDAQYADIIVKHATLEVMTDDELAHLIEQLNYAEQQSKIFEKMVAQRVALNNQLTKQLDTEKKLTGEQYAQSFGTNFYLNLGKEKPKGGEIKDVPVITDEELYSYEPVEVPVQVPNVKDAKKALEEFKATEVSAAEGLSAISSAMGSISGVMDEGAAAWMNYASGIISSVSSALPSLQALATAQATVAGTSAAINPWTAIASVAAVASIAAAMADLPKFATGGVVPGNALIGDNVLIRANSGEVVLNREQQNILSQRLEGGLSGKVEFVIRDSVLYGILNRGNAYNSRAYHGS